MVSIIKAHGTQKQAQTGTLNSSLTVHFLQIILVPFVSCTLTNISAFTPLYWVIVSANYFSLMKAWPGKTWQAFNKYGTKQVGACCWTSYVCMRALNAGMHISCNTKVNKHGLSYGSTADFPNVQCCLHVFSFPSVQLWDHQLFDGA